MVVLDRDDCACMFDRTGSVPIIPKSTFFPKMFFQFMLITFPNPMKFQTLQSVHTQRYAADLGVLGQEDMDSVCIRSNCVSVTFKNQGKGRLLLFSIQSSFPSVVGYMYAIHWIISVLRICFQENRHFENTHYLEASFSSI